MRGSELISEFLKHSPFVVHLGIELVEVRVRGAEDDKLLASGPVTYKLG